MNITPIEITETTATYKFIGEISTQHTNEINNLKTHNLNIIIDLSECTHMNSLTLGLLILLHNNAKSNNKSLTLTNVPDNILDMLKSNCLDKILNIEASDKSN